MTVKDDLIARGLPCEWADGANAGFTRPLTDAEIRIYNVYRGNGEMTETEFQARKARAVALVAPLANKQHGALSNPEKEALILAMAQLLGLADETDKITGVVQSRRSQR